MTDQALRPPEAGFLGTPVQTDLAQLDADVAILGVPHGVPYPHGETGGCADAPSAIRRRSQRMARFRGHHDFDLDGPMLPAHDGLRIVDFGDVPTTTADGAGNASRTEAAVRGLLEAGVVPIVLGGDDSVPIPVLRAFPAHPPFTVLQIDAHLDFRDEVAGVRDGYSSSMRRAAEMEHIDRIIQVGLRGVGSARAADVADARAAGNLLVTARQLRERGVPWLIEQLPMDAALFVCFDLDGLDPSVCPAVSAPAPGGLSSAEAFELLAGAARRCRVAGAAFTELVPALDANELCALVAVRLIVALLSRGP